MTWPSVRTAGVLLHVTSLGGPGPIGTIGSAARAFVDWAASAGFSVWQVLPLGPPGHGDAPYGCLSSFAGNPLLVDPDDLVAEGLLDPGVLAERPEAGRTVGFDAAHAWSSTVLRRAWRRFRERPDPNHAAGFREFTADPRHRRWLDDWTLFMALKEENRGRPWTEWPSGERDRRPGALAAARRRLDDDVGLHRFAQYLFFRQWSRLREHARARGVDILGDVPIYTVLDSADVWGSRDVFRIDDRGRPEAVAGVPPDYFSETGQLWGNPLYRWDRLAATGYAWWVDRIRANLELFDAVRLDHFRGFASYWEVPPDEDTAVEGRWVPGPGRALFDAIRDRLGDLPFVAEDLGLITEDVHRLREDLGLPGMKVLQFGFDDVESIHRHDRVPEGDVVYTGTHDNDTTRGWFEALDDARKERVLAALAAEPADVVDAMVRAAFASDARLAMVPMQDVLGLGNEARMNVPGVESGNWRWRLTGARPQPGPATRIRDLARETGRLPD